MSSRSSTGRSSTGSTGRRSARDIGVSPRSAKIESCSMRDAGGVRTASSALSTAPLVSMSMIRLVEVGALPTRATRQVADATHRAERRIQHDLTDGLVFAAIWDANWRHDCRGRTRP